MATELKLRRGTTSQHSGFTGAEAEVTVDTDKETVVVHDGATAGGYPVAREDMSNVPNDAISGDQIAGGNATFDSITANDGVYLGGTGSANKLDDYEEGTWGGSASLIATNTSATSISVTNATYQKIGDRVTVEGIVGLTGDNFSSVGDYVSFDGLPFTAKAYGGSKSPSVGSCGTGGFPTGNRNGNGSARVQENTDSVLLVLTSEPQGSPIGSDDEIAFTLSYLIA